MSSDTAIREALPAELAGLVRSISLKGGVATIVADGTGLGHAAGEQVRAELSEAASAVAGVDEVRVALMADKVERRIVAVGSGKGGVGKSTLTANLAVALARMGHKVGVVDADIYGPSQPTLLGGADVKLTAKDKTLIPFETAYGVKTVSMAQLVDPGKALAWRGPMVGSALAQLMEADWGDTDLLLADLPPGTGDVQLTMLQKFKPIGAVVVSTPQDLALIDAARAVDLFAQAKVPVLGVVENMAGYLCPHCGEGSDPFGSGGAEVAAEKMGAPFLGRIPLAPAIRTASDAGTPPAADDGPAGEPFRAIAARLADMLEPAA